MSEPIGICVIGAGAIAERHMQAYQQLGGVLPRWVVSRPAEAARDFAHRWNFAHSGTSVEPAFADSSVQLVLIASPSPLHSEQAARAMQAGKDVVVEIPVALSWPDAQKVAQVAATLGRRAWVCHTLRSTPALRLVRERVQTLLGPVHPTFGMALDVGVQLVTAGGELITQSLSYNVEQSVWQLQFIGYEDVLTFQDGRLTNEVGQKLVPETPIVDLTVQNRELLHAFRSGEKCEYELPAVLATMEVLGRAQACAERAPDDRIAES